MVLAAELAQEETCVPLRRGEMARGGLLAGAWCRSAAGCGSGLPGKL